ncbi:hypothetical protein BBK36DRAFT_1135538, partial [Trichoderma citrinoviride]
KPKLLEAKAWMRKSHTWMRLFRLLQIMHIEVVRTSLYADLARSLALHCLIGTLAVLPWHLGPWAPSSSSAFCSQWDGRAGVVPVRRVGQCLLLLFGAGGDGSLGS